MVALRLTNMSMVLLSLVMSLTSVVVEVALTEGGPITATLQSLDDRAVRLSADEESRLIPLNAIKQIRVSESSNEIVRPVRVQMTDGSVATSDAFIMSGGEAQLVAGDLKWKLSVTSLRAVRWLASSRAFDEPWNEILETPTTDDLLVIRRENSLDYLPGIVSAVTDDAIEFEYSGNKIPVPLTKAIGFILARKREDPPAPRLRVRTQDGSKWLLRSARLSDGTLTVVSMASVSHKLSLSDIARIEFSQVGMTSLSDLEPSSVKFEPFFGSQLGQQITRLYGPQYDQSISIPDPSSKSGVREFQRGLALQSRTELVYRLAGKYQRFRATASIDPTSSNQADVEVVLLLDNKEAYRRSIAKSDSLVEIDVDVAAARRLTLLIDYGANIHLGDRLYLGDARLIK